MLHHIPALMSKGSPVAVQFTEKEGKRSSSLYCELIQKARHGESFHIKSQGCSVGAYVLGECDESPVDYYCESKRYADRNAAKTAASNLCRLENRRSIRIAPYSGQVFDIIILFLKPERAMRIIQAYSYLNGNTVKFKTGGIASVCSDCTAYPAKGVLGISPGCKGSRKHSKYLDEEMVVGIPFKLAIEIEDSLVRIPETIE